jgi:hypothetical protein
VRLHHRPEVLNGGEGIGVSGGQLLRSLKPCCHVTLGCDEFRYGTVDYL